MFVSLQLINPKQDLVHGNVTLVMVDEKELTLHKDGRVLLYPINEVEFIINK